MPPTPAALIAAILMKSRRRTPSPSANASGSAVPVVVAITLPCLPAPWRGGCPRETEEFSTRRTPCRLPRGGGLARLIDDALGDANHDFGGIMTGYCGRPISEICRP